MKQNLTNPSLRGAYIAPQTEEMIISVEGNLLYSGNGTINNLTDHTYSWDDSDWEDA